MKSLALTTELEAVNIMLGTIGESPVSSLAAESSMVDVAIARQVLRELTMEVQGEGWHFNTEKAWSLTPTADTGEIPVPNNCIQIDSSGPSVSRDVVARGTRLYDLDARTYQFTGPVTVDMVILLPFDDMPQACRYYVAIRAARVFQQRMVGSSTLAAFSETDELRARAAFRKMDANNADYNILSGSWSVARILRR